MLIEAAWHYHKTPAVGKSLKKRQAGQSESLKEISWDAHYLSKDLADFMWDVIETQSSQPSGNFFVNAFRDIKFNNIPLWQVIWEQVGAGFVGLHFIESEPRVYSHLAKETSSRVIIR